MSREGRGFLHLNTPSSITYTAGQKVSLSSLKAKKSRVETIQLPRWILHWREAKKRFIDKDGYKSFATDVEEEREGAGPVLPSVAPDVTGAKTNPSGRFFIPSVGTGSTVGSSCSPSGSESNKEPSKEDGSTAGISIVSHHKILGECQFTYPDYDGVLLNGTVPEVVVSLSEQKEREARRAYYISPKEMTEEEADALKELQALWRNRSLSHSFDGAQLRKAQGEAEGFVGSSGVHRKNRPSSSHASYSHDKVETDANEEDIMDLDETLRMADDLLRFA